MALGPACPRCRGAVAETAAICPHCGTYLLDWSSPIEVDSTPSQPPPNTPPHTPQRRPWRRPRLARPIDTHTTLAALRLVVGVAMAVHALLVVARLLDDPRLLIAWIALWLPLDGFWRSTRPRKDR